MPHIIVQHTEEVVHAFAEDGTMLGSLDEKLRTVAAAHLSVPERQLTPQDFSIMFLKAGPFDRLMQDIQVIIFAHADEVRVVRIDELAEAIATGCEEAIVNSYPRPGDEPEDVSFSVLIHLGQVGFYKGVETIGMP